MIGALMVGLLFGCGALMVLTSQPFGAAKPPLSARLDALRPDLPAKIDPPIVPVFRTFIFEELLRPALQQGGDLLLSASRRAGLDLNETARRLRLTGDAGGLGLFLGLKLASGLVGLAIFPVASALRLFPHTPLWIWLGFGAAWFLLPDALLRTKAEQVQRELREGLARFADLVSLSVSAGLGLEGAVEEAAGSLSGPFAEELRKSLRDSQLNSQPISAALAHLADELSLREAEPLASALDVAVTQGLAISQVLHSQARSIRERRRLQLIEEAERAQVRMALPVGVLILPAFFLLLLYPAAVQLLQVTAGR
jgi:tight adherence protein C